MNINEYQVELGLLLSHSIDEREEGHIFMFAPEGWVIVDHLSRKIPG